MMMKAASKPMPMRAIALVPTSTARPPAKTTRSSIDYPAKRLKCPALPAELAARFLDLRGREQRLPLRNQRERLDR
jgi:hypothetical protein